MISEVRKLAKTNFPLVIDDETEQNVMLWDKVKRLTKIFSWKTMHLKQKSEFLGA